MLQALRAESECPFAARLEFLVRLDSLLTLSILSDKKRSKGQERSRVVKAQPWSINGQYRALKLGLLIPSLFAG